MNSNNETKYKDSNASNINITNNNNEINLKNKENNIIGYNAEKFKETVNFLELLTYEDNQNISLMITNPNGLIIIFFSKYVVYYKYDSIFSHLSRDRKTERHYPDEGGCHCECRQQLAAGRGRRGRGDPPGSGA